MRSTFSYKEQGQIILWFAVVVPLLILFAAMALDMGLIYVKKAQLANAIDAAVLTGAKNYSLGIPTAEALATNMFNANFGANPPPVTYTWCPRDASCSGTSLSLTATATAIVNTTFMAYLPAFAQWHVKSTATATRANLVMSLVLDRSGSMSGNGGGIALQAAVPVFVSYFVPGTDYISMISFASHATVNVPETVQFVVPITSAVDAFSFIGGTFGTGAGSNPYDNTKGPPLSMADHQINSVIVPEPEVKVVVYFTDGLMNAVQDTFNCTNSPPGPTLYNYGGYDCQNTPCVAGDPVTTVAALDPASETQWGNIPTNGPPPYAGGASCQGVATFPSQLTGSNLTFTRAHVTAEAQYRAKTTAKAMQSESPNAAFIYVIGLGTKISDDTATEAFLSTLANDPSGPAKYGAGAGYDPNLPAGLFLVVPNCPSPTCTAGLTTAFQTIAAKILLRLSR
jgi:Flp pilus assembly protein TadG